MRRKAILYTLLVMATSLVGACAKKTTAPEVKENKFTGEFINETEIGIVLNGTYIKKFDQEAEQIVYSDDKKLFMISNMDNSSHFTLELDNTPYLNKNLNILYSCNGIENLGNSVEEFKVVKIDTVEGRYWLWNSDLSLGFIVDYIF